LLSLWRFWKVAQRGAIKDQLPGSNKSDDEHSTLWSQQQALELWKYNNGLGATDKNTMVTVEAFATSLARVLSSNYLARGHQPTSLSFPRRSVDGRQ
jgi:hypothetical protein